MLHSSAIVVALSIMEVVVAASSPLRIATYNLRYDSKPDNISVAQSLSALPDPLQAPVYLGNSGEQPWSTRRLRVSERILGENVTILGASGHPSGHGDRY